jgi:molybdenum cofactor guanylyltransferase
MTASRTDSKNEIVGVILAGGLSRRMGGGDKGLLDLAGNSMIGRVITRIRPQVATLVLNANGDPARFATLALPVAADTVDGFVGPLAGVLAGMRWAARHVPSARWIATVSSDAPFLPDDLVPQLHAAIADKPTAVAIARSEGELHPVIGLWPIALADDLEQELRAGVRKVLRWTDKHGTIPVDFAKVHVAGQSVDPFFNANTPEELDEARQLLAKSAS